LVDIDTDVYSTKTVVVKDGEPVETKQAIFDYDELHEETPLQESTSRNTQLGETNGHGNGASS